MNNLFLHGQPIAVSISNSPDLAELGLSLQHLRDAMAEVARHLLAAGAHLIYGGDLRAHGFTELLFEIVARHHRDAPNSGWAVTNFLAWPAHMQLTSAELEQRIADLQHIGTLVCLTQEGGELTTDQRATLSLGQPSKTDWANGLTAMRRIMTECCFARVLVGGQVKGYKGRMPGIAEEALLALNANKPVFLIGGFGGCTHDIAESMGFSQPHSTSRQTAWKSRSKFKALRVDNLNNGLAADENARLARTVHTDEIMALILRGLHRLVA